MGKEYSVKLSVVVPTKDRYENLKALYHQTLELLETGQVELVVYDTSGDRDSRLAKMLEEDRNVRYIFSLDSSSISETISQALTYASGEFVTVIGDDDFLHPDVLRYLSNAACDDTDIVIHTPAHYWWPDIVFVENSRSLRPASLVFAKDYSAEISELSSEKERGRFFDSGSMYIGRLPRLYHGFVRRVVLKELVDFFGEMVVGSSPDISLALQLSYVRKKYVHIDFPLTVYGACYNSGGGMTARKEHYGDIEKMSFLPANIGANWDINLPKVWTERVIYAQTAYEVSEKIGKSCRTNLFRTYVGLLVYEHKLNSIFIPFFIERVGIVQTVVIVTRSFLIRMIRHLRLRFSSRNYRVIYNVDPYFVNNHLGNA